MSTLKREAAAARRSLRKPPIDDQIQAIHDRVARRFISEHPDVENDPAWVAHRLAYLEPGFYITLKPTAAVMSVAARMIGREGLEVHTDRHGLVFRRKPGKATKPANTEAVEQLVAARVENKPDHAAFTEPGREGLGLPLASIGPGGIGHPLSREVRDAH